MKTKTNKKPMKLSQESLESSQGATHVALCWKISCCDESFLHESLFMRTRTKPNLFDAAVEHQDKKC